jgi:2-C-methyl-D-erythritol 2,4-cyclodiphosphate synthase
MSEAAVIEAAPQREVAPATPALRLVGIGRRFRQGEAWLEVLRGAALALAPGSVVALMGPSGSGKSTLLQIAGLLEHPDGGEVFLGGRACGRLSDADVALHALTDALLGTIGAGDIGKHFPPSDPQWRGVSSDRFLRHAVDLVDATGGRIVHLDLTLVCEAPRIGPHRDAMVTSIARIAGIERDRVSVKATTTEGLGFTGRREGIAAQAVATVEVPRR